METASRYGSKPNVYSSPVADDVSVEVKIKDEGPRMGADAQLGIFVKNLSAEPRQTTLYSQVAVMYYTGVLKSTIKKEQIHVELLPNEGRLSPKLFNANYNGGHAACDQTKQTLRDRTICSTLCSLTG